MLDDRLPVQQSVTRTLTITTVETWSITIGGADAAPPEENNLEVRPKHAGVTSEQHEPTKPESIHREEP